MKKYLLILQQAPFANYNATEGIELALALSAFEQTVSLLFVDTGVLQLVNDKQTELIQIKDPSKVLAGFDLFDIKQVYAQQSALRKYSLAQSDLICKPEVITDHNIADIITQHDIVLTI